MTTVWVRLDLWCKNVKRPWTKVLVTTFLHLNSNAKDKVTKKFDHGKIKCKKAKNIVKLRSSAQKLQFQTIFPYKLCFTEKRTYVNELKFPTLDYRIVVGLSLLLNLTFF